jgi:lysozyme
VDSLVYKGKWAFWQHTDVGKVDGIKGDVDINLFNGKYQDLVDMTIKTDEEIHIP